MPKKDAAGTNLSPPETSVFWIETSNTVSRCFQFEPDGQLSVSLFLYFLLLPFSLLDSSEENPL